MAAPAPRCDLGAMNSPFVRTVAWGVVGLLVFALVATLVLEGFA
jgi:hypothetical protein